MEFQYNFWLARLILFKRVQGLMLTTY